MLQRAFVARTRQCSHDKVLYPVAVVKVHSVQVDKKHNIGVTTIYARAQWRKVRSAEIATIKNAGSAGRAHVVALAWSELLAIVLDRSKCRAYRRTQRMSREP